jgi:tetratricopeptide (TPR) repeat protein
LPESIYDHEDDAENLLRLERMLTRAQGFALAFARVNAPSRRVELVKEIRERVEAQGVKIIEIDLREPVGDLHNEIMRRLHGILLNMLADAKAGRATGIEMPRGAIFVYGLEHSISSSERYHPVLAVANYKRENFRNNVPAPLVFWLPEYVLQAIMEGAPDFWAWRSGVFEFAGPKEDIEKHWLVAPLEPGQIELSRMTLPEKRKRIELLSDLLAEYEGRKDLDSPEIAAIRLNLYNRIGRLYCFLGEYDHALECHNHAYEIAQPSDNKAGLAGSLHEIGMIHQARENYAAALAEHEKALKIVEELGDREGVAKSLHQIGNIHYLQGDYEAALTMHKKSQRIFEELGSRASVARSLHQIGLIHLARKDDETALAECEKSRKIFEECGDRAGVARSLLQAGIIHYLSEAYAAAQAEYEKALKIFEELGDRPGLAKSLQAVGMAHQARGDYAAALAQHEKALKIAEELGNRPEVAITRGQIGKLFTQTAQYPRAFEHLYFAYTTLIKLQLPNAMKTANELKNLRAKWGVENFDAAWEKATSEAVPGWLKEVA